MAQLTATSYALLGLLAVRPWSTYELAQQVQTSLRHFWPRSERQLYEQPKVLVEHGLATAEQEVVGRRPRTVYRITPKGRRALRTWLETPGGCASFEWEALVKVFFAEHGTKEALVAQLEAVLEENRSEEAAHRDLGHERVRDRPFADRMHINALVSQFFHEYTEAVERWATWAIDEVKTWSSVDEPPADLERLLAEVFGEAAAVSPADPAPSSSAPRR